MVRLVYDKPLYEMANLQESTLGERFELWLDETKKDKNVGHNLPRFKPKANGVELDIVIDGDTVRFDKANTSKPRKFKYGKDAIKFVEKFKKALLLHWNKKIDTFKLGMIIYLVNKKHYSVDAAINDVLNDNF